MANGNRGLTAEQLQTAADIRAKRIDPLGAAARAARTVIPIAGQALGVGPAAGLLTRTVLPGGPQDVGEALAVSPDEQAIRQTVEARGQNLQGFATPEQLARTTAVPAPQQPTIGPAAQPGTATATTTTTVTQPAALSRADAAAGIKAKRGAFGEQQALLGETESIQRKWQADAANYVLTLGKRGDAAHKRFQELDQELTRLKRETKGTDLELLGGFDQTSRAMLVIAAALEGGAAASLRRPSNTVGLLSMAVNQDMARQRANLQKNLRLTQMTEQQRNRALNRYDQLEQQRRQQVGQVAQLQLAELGTRQKGIDAKLDLANSILQLKQLSRPKSTTTRVTKEVPVGGGIQVDKAQARKFKENLGQFRAGKSEVQKLKGLLGEARGSVVRGAVVPTGLGIKIRKSLDTLALINRKVLGDSGPIRGDDIKTFDRIGASGFLSQALGDKGDMLDRLESFDRDIDSAIRRESKLLLSDPAQLALENVRAGQAAEQAQNVSFRPALGGQ